jgi:hypothetical protein
VVLLLTVRFSDVDCDKTGESNRNDLPASHRPDTYLRKCKEVSLSSGRTVK